MNLILMFTMMIVFLFSYWKSKSHFFLKLAVSVACFCTKPLRRRTFHLIALPDGKKSRPRDFRNNFYGNIFSYIYFPNTTCTQQCYGRYMTFLSFGNWIFSEMVICLFMRLSKLRFFGHIYTLVWNAVKGYSFVRKRYLILIMKYNVWNCINVIKGIFMKMLSFVNCCSSTILTANFS